MTFILEEGEMAALLAEVEEDFTVGTDIAEATEITELGKVADEALEVPEGIEVPEDIATTLDGEQFEDLQPEISEEETSELGKESPKELQKEVWEKVKGFVSKLGSKTMGFLESPIGKVVIESIGQYFKFDMIMKLTEAGVKEVENIIKLIKGVDAKGNTPEQNATIALLENYSKFVSSLFKIVVKIHTSLKNASTFSTGNTSKADDKGPSIEDLAGQMTVNDYKSLMDTVKIAWDKSSKLLMNLQQSLKTIDIPQDEKQQKAFMAKIKDDPTKIKTAIGIIQPEAITDFTKSMDEFSQVSKKILTKTYESKEDKDRVSKYFFVPTNWKETANALQSFIKQK